MNHGSPLRAQNDVEAVHLRWAETVPFFSLVDRPFATGSRCFAGCVVSRSFCGSLLGERGRKLPAAALERAGCLCLAVALFAGAGRRASLLGFLKLVLDIMITGRKKIHLLN